MWRHAAELRRQHGDLGMTIRPALTPKGRNEHGDSLYKTAIPYQNTPGRIDAAVVSDTMQKHTAFLVCWNGVRIRLGHSLGTHRMVSPSAMVPSALSLAAIALLPYG